MNDLQDHPIPVGRQISCCPTCGRAVVRVNGVVVEYPLDGCIIGRRFPVHNCEAELAPALAHEEGGGA